MRDVCEALGQAEPRRVRITDLTPRDGQQCKLATRVRTDDLLPLCEKMDAVGFYAVEVWGGATYDVCLRYLWEDPWERLKRIKEVMPRTKLQMLLRGQNIVGYRPRSDRVVKKFVEQALEHGVQVFRVFDSLNDNRNIATATRAIKELGGEAHAEINYTISPAHTHERWMAYAREVAALEPDWISVKDATGILMPFDAYRLIRGVREVTEGKIPVLLHNHDMSGTAMMNHLVAVVAGAEMLDTVLSPLAFGASHPATESVVASLKNTPYDTGLDLTRLDELAGLTKKIRRKYTQYETEYAGVNSKVLIHKIPGGMVSNMVAQLAEAGATELMDEALEEVPRVAEDLGFPPLLTPSSQIVGVQAVLNVIAGERYATLTKEVRDYVAGRYGRPPGPISGTLQQAVLGNGDLVDFSVQPGDQADPEEWDKAVRELGDLADSETDVLLHLLFPLQARELLTLRSKGELRAKALAEGGAPEAKTGNGKVPVDFDLIYHGEKFRVNVEGASTFVGDSGRRKYYIRVDGHLEEIQLTPHREIVPAERNGVATTTAAGNGIPKASLPGDATSLMPGTVARILVEEGQTVRKGQPIALVEAMKMENEIAAPLGGVVEKIFARPGDSVETDDALLRIEALDG